MHFSVRLPQNYSTTTVKHFLKEHLVRILSLVQDNFFYLVIVFAKHEAEKLGDAW